jgi:hypothetical protein
MIIFGFFLPPIPAGISGCRNPRRQAQTQGKAFSVKQFAASAKKHLTPAGGG